MTSLAPRLRIAGQACWRACVLLPLVLGGAGCLGVFADPSGSASLGSNARGALFRGVEVPAEGPGYAVPETIRARHARWATAETAAWLSRSFAALAEVVPDALVPLGDVSRRRGGQAPGHRSHESGRDVDLFFLARHEDGTRFYPQQAMIRFGADGRARAWSPPMGVARPRLPLPPVRFDAAGNWTLVRSLLNEPSAEVQFIFINRALAALLLDEARRQGEASGLVARAEALFHSPGNVDPHDDHMHVRVFCDPGDRPYGCVDHGTQRWWKKRWKYMSSADVQVRGSEPLVASSVD